MLRVVEGRAPGALTGLPAPDAVFVGGGASTPGVIEACLAALRPGGRLVANAVTIETEAVLADWRRRVGGRLRRIAISRAEPVGAYTAFRPALPVTQWVHTMPLDAPAGSDYPNSDYPNFEYPSGGATRSTGGRS